MSQQDYFIQFASELGKLNGNIESVLKRLEKGDEKMAQHESRISTLELNARGEASASNGSNGYALPRWAVYVIVGLLSALLGALGVKIPEVM